MTDYQVLDVRFSEPAAANGALQRALKGRGDVLDSIPSVPAVLESLLAELAQPAEDVNLLRIAELIGRDKALAARCLRMANSARFGGGTRTDSLRGAVRRLGLAHTRDVAVSSTMTQVLGAQKVLDPLVFWKHALGCAILSRKLARCVGFNDSEKAYLAGLLHDLGYVVNLVLMPQESKAALDKALQTGMFMGESELASLGFTHCQSGEFLARKWNFAPDLVEVILCHHNPAAAVLNPALVTIVSLADRLCRSGDLGLGYTEAQDPAAVWQSDWELLQKALPQAAHLQWSDFTKDAEAYFGEIRELVTAMFEGH